MHPPAPNRRSCSARGPSFLGGLKASSPGIAGRGQTIYNSTPTSHCVFLETNVANPVKPLGEMPRPGGYFVVPTRYGPLYQLEPPRYLPRDSGAL